jgi:hypothetical protein
VAGNLSIGRTQSSGYTANELNSLFDNFVTQYASTLPSAVRTRCENEFDNISISDDDPIASGIDGPDSLYRAIAYLGENLQGDCEDEPNSNSTWSWGVIAGTTINGWGMTVRDLALDDDDDDAYTITVSTNYTNPYASLLDNYDGNGIQRAKSLQAITVVDRVQVNTVNWNTFIQQQGQRVPCSNTSTNTGNIPAFLGGNTIADRRFNGLTGLSVPTIYSSITVTPTSYSGGTTITLSDATEQVVDGGLSDNQSYPTVTVERFNGIGVDEWGPSLTSALTTLTTENFTQTFGGNLDSWNIDDPTKLTSEPFSDGWPLGTQPTKDNCSGGGSVNELTEILTSQINGTRQTFTLTRSYVSGSLRVYWNGQRQTVGDTITEDNDTQFTTTFIATTGTELIVDFVAK